jgi:hypothetical protein
MPPIVGVLEPGKHPLSDADAAGNLNLGEAGALAKLKNLVGDISIGEFLLKTLLTSQIVAGDGSISISILSMSAHQHIQGRPTSNRWLKISGFTRVTAF